MAAPTTPESARVDSSRHAAREQPFSRHEPLGGTAGKNAFEIDYKSHGGTFGYSGRFPGQCGATEPKARSGRKLDVRGAELAPEDVG